MSEVITAVYEKGVLRPLQPLDLREQQTVYLQLLPAEPEEEVEVAIKPQVLAALNSTGLVTTPAPAIKSQPRVRLTPIEAGGQPASEIIIKERGQDL
jgi:predicted DNA-binding antitoxin AbrB/MazE fold protein